MGWHKIVMLLSVAVIRKQLLLLVGNKKRYNC